MASQKQGQSAWSSQQGGMNKAKGPGIVSVGKKEQSTGTMHILMIQLKVSPDTHTNLRQLNHGARGACSGVGALWR